NLKPPWATKSTSGKSPPSTPKLREPSTATNTPRPSYQGMPSGTPQAFDFVLALGGVALHRCDKRGTTRKGRQPVLSRSEARGL
ncbi:MAG: hypothetical protein WCB11_21425, partial [Terriglobales bacterium]